MKNRLASMQKLRDHLAQLLALCNMEDDVRAVEVLPPPWLICFAESIQKDSTLSSYLEALDERVKEATVKMEEQRLELWNSEQNEQRLQELEHELAALRASAEAAPGDSPAPLEMIRDLIAIRDTLLMRKTWLWDHEASASDTEKLVDFQLREIGNCLERAGVTVLEEQGDFDAQLQNAVETRPTDDPAQVGRVAETLRPGYQFRGDTLRPQEVVLYVKE